MSARSLLFLTLLVVLAGAAATATQLHRREPGAEPAALTAPVLDIRFEPIVTGLERPLFLTTAADDTERLFVVEQAGRVRVIRDGVLLARPFLDIVALVGSSLNEQGLLSIAFHPDYARNGQFYVDYTNVDGDTVIARFNVSATDPDIADPTSGQTLLFVDQPAANHNGGLLLFGPDGYLYIGLGDGGGPGNSRNGQLLGTHLGKILRIDVDHTDAGLPYAIPAGNPLIDVAGARPEIWLYGLRNPWRFSFDPATGDLYIGDVGAATIEEVNIVPAGTSGLNLGWNIYEGWRCNIAEDLCDQLGMAASLGLTWPAVVYRHGERDCAITGGHVYRGNELPSLHGVYIYADYCSGRIWGLVREPSGRALVSDPLDTDLRISSFGLDEAGELYVVDLQGGVYRVRGE